MLKITLSDTNKQEYLGNYYKRNYRVISLLWPDIKTYNNGIDK